VTVERSYFFDLVVDFLPEDFLPADFADLLELFFAMALTSFLERQIYGSVKKPSTKFF
jgi:hypothetical protein